MKGGLALDRWGYDLNLMIEFEQTDMKLCRQTRLLLEKSGRAFVGWIGFE